MKKMKIKYICGHTMSVWVVPPEFQIALFGFDKAVKVSAESIKQDRCPKCEGCDRDYNSAGQELAPREQWGEDTGESLSDILQIK